MCIMCNSVQVCYVYQYLYKTLDGQFNLDKLLSIKGKKKYKSALKSQNNKLLIYSCWSWISNLHLIILFCYTLISKFTVDTSARTGGGLCTMCPNMCESSHLIILSRNLSYLGIRASLRFCLIHPLLNICLDISFKI